MDYYGQPHWFRGWWMYKPKQFGLGLQVTWYFRQIRCESRCPVFIVSGHFGPAYWGVRVEKPHPWLPKP